MNGDGLGEAAQGFLAAIAKSIHGTNMSLERLLALMRSASPSFKGRKPRASKYVCRGNLTQHLRRHVDSGSSDSRGQAKRAQLVKEGVQVALKSNHKKEKGTARWHVRYGNHKVVEYQAAFIISTICFLLMLLHAGLRRRHTDALRPCSYIFGE